MQGKELQGLRGLGAGLPEAGGGEKTAAGRHRVSLNSTFLDLIPCHPQLTSTLSPMGGLVMALCIVMAELRNNELRVNKTFLGVSGRD